MDDGDDIIKSSIWAHLGCRITVVLLARFLTDPLLTAPDYYVLLFFSQVDDDDVVLLHLSTQPPPAVLQSFQGGETNGPSQRRHVQVLSQQRPMQHRAPLRPPLLSPPPRVEKKNTHTQEEK